MLPACASGPSVTNDLNVNRGVHLDVTSTYVAHDAETEHGLASCTCRALPSFAEVAVVGQDQNAGFSAHGAVAVGALW
jgi:hypothetical protein